MNDRTTPAAPEPEPSDVIAVARRRWPDSPPWSSTTRLWVFTLVLGLCLFVWWQVREFTGMVVLACLLTYMMHPFVGRVQRHGRLGRAKATAVVYAALAALILVAALVLGRSVVTGLTTINPRQVWDETVAELVLLLPERVSVLGNSVELRGAYAAVQGDLINLGQLAVAAFRPVSVNWLMGAATTFAFAVLGLMVIFFTSFYLTLDGTKILRYFEAKTPAPYRPTQRSLLGEVDAVWQHFFRGQFLLALSVGVLTTLGLLLLGVRYAVLLGIIAGVLEVVPRVGPVLSTIPGIAVALVNPSTTLPAMPRIAFVLLVIGMYILVQAAENNILVPRILGNSVNLPPAVMLIGALAGAALGGFVGILLAAPILGSVRVLGSWLWYQLIRPDHPSGPGVREPAAVGPPDDPKASHLPAPGRSGS
jgi:predicted PurR-regulated permease PerM